MPFGIIQQSTLTLYLRGVEDPVTVNTTTEYADRIGKQLKDPNGVLESTYRGHLLQFPVRSIIYVEHGTEVLDQDAKVELWQDADDTLFLRDPESYRAWTIAVDDRAGRFAADANALVAGDWVLEEPRNRPRQLVGLTRIATYRRRGGVIDIDCRPGTREPFAGELGRTYVGLDVFAAAAERESLSA